MAENHGDIAQPFSNVPIVQVEAQLLWKAEAWLEEHKKEISSLPQRQLEEQLYSPLREHLAHFALNHLAPIERVDYIVNNVIGEIKVILSKQRPRLESLEVLKSYAAPTSASDIDWAAN